MFKYYLAVLKKYATFSGRARRKEYWYFALMNFIIGICACIPIYYGIFKLVFTLAAQGDNISKEAFITHADVDHCGLLPLFDIVYASSKSAESLKSEYNNKSN